MKSQAGIPVDVALGAMPFEERAVARASEFVIQPGVTLVTCSAEDLIVFKAFAGHERAWLDIEGIALRLRLGAFHPPVGSAPLSTPRRRS